MQRISVKTNRQQIRDTFGISLAIPAYGRASELCELLQSIYAQTVLPAEITICEDKSSDRDEIRAIVSDWKDRFAAESCRIVYLENELNLGYDGNLRKVINVSSEPWVMLMGNDDILLPECVETAARYIAANPQIRMISRSFLMFHNDVNKPKGVSQLSSEDQVFNSRNSSPKMMLRTCGFVGGLIVDRNWASAAATNRYDGSLYYQIYLAAIAFCQDGIGYISKTIVGSRVGNPPLFGSAVSEKDAHVPGSYTPKGRAKMWASVVQIARDVGEQTGVNLHEGVRNELKVRQSFHIFEMMAGAGRQRLSELRSELEALGLFGHPVPYTLYLINLLLGSRAKLFYQTVRKLRQYVHEGGRLFLVQRLRVPTKIRCNTDTSTGSA